MRATTTIQVTEIATATLTIDTQRILNESAVVARAIRRHERVAELRGRPNEAEAMHWLGYGVARLAHRLATMEPPRLTAREALRS